MIKVKKVFAASITAVLLTIAIAGCSAPAPKNEANDQDITAESLQIKEDGLQKEENAEIKVEDEKIVIEGETSSAEGEKVAEVSITPTPAPKAQTAAVPKAKISSRSSTTASKPVAKSTSTATKTAAKPTPTPKPAPASAGKAAALDWWSEAQYVFPRGAVAKVTDVYTGKSFNLKRTYGTNHADCEAVTSKDSEIIKSIWGGWSWVRRPVVVVVNGKRIAASMTAMPHAGLDKYPALQTVDNRSGGYGTGTNLDEVKGNGMDGHIDVHFLNSRTHGTNKVEPQHQAAIQKAIGK